jgi:homoserine O-acetyltransferase
LVSTQHDFSTDAAQGVLQWRGRLSLHHGGSLDQPQLAWRLAGAEGAPIVLALGGISAHRRVFDAEQPRSGWWSEVAGPGLALDSQRLRVLGIDYLGGNGASSGPAPGGAFPSLSSYDQALVLRQLLDELGIARLRAIVGASYGAMVGLAFAQRHAERLEQLVLISGAERAHPMATAWRSVQRRMVRFALAAGRGEEGVALARALAMATYRSPAEFATRFSGAPRLHEGRFVFPVEDYLFARGRDYALRYRAESMLCLSESIDLHHVDATQVMTPTTVVAVREDQLVPLEDMRALAARLPRARLHEIASVHGHDAFLKEAEALQPIFEQSIYEGAQQ